MVSSLPAKWGSGPYICGRNETMTLFRRAFLLLITLLPSACGEPESNDAVAQANIKMATSLESSNVSNEGQQVYESFCSSCHAEGQGHPGTVRLAIRLGKDRSVLTQRNDLHIDYVKTIVRQGIMLMPPFRPSEITDSELQALAVYLAK